MLNIAKKKMFKTSEFIKLRIKKKNFLKLRCFVLKFHNGNHSLIKLGEMTETALHCFELLILFFEMEEILFNSKQKFDKFKLGSTRFKEYKILRNKEDKTGFSCM